MRMLLTVAVFAVFVAGCSSFRCPLGEEGFVWFDGTVSTVAQGDCYVLRYEYPGEFVTDSPRWMKGRQRWHFVEVRQLKDSVTVVDDGKFRTEKRRIPGVNWLKWIKPGARNIRIRFVDETYSVAAENAGAAPEGFVALFNGRDLDGWKGVTREEGFNLPKVRREATVEKRREMQAKADKSMREHWFVKDGALYFDGLEGGYSIATVKDYADFEMFADWRLLRVNGDSGFYLRGLPQVQIWDPNTWGGIGSGGLYNNAKALSNATTCEDLPIGDWNRCRIRMTGDKVSVWLNGVKVVDEVKMENCRNPNEPIPPSEQIELQCHGDPIEFRNIFIREQ